jgi:sec-independent protein translocase protein TatA
MGSDVLIVLVIVLVIVLIWQGPKNLPKLGSALGRSISDFRKEVSDDKPADQAAPATPAPPTTPTTAAPPTTPTTPTTPTDHPGA